MIIIMIMKIITIIKSVLLINHNNDINNYSL